MSYTLTASREQIEHIRVCNAIKCFETHFRLARPDSSGKYVPFFDVCVNCRDTSICRPFRKAAYCEENGL